MTHATWQKEKEEQAGRRSTRRLSLQTDRERGGGSKATNASAATGIQQKKVVGKKAAQGQEKSGKKAEDKGKQPTPRKRVSTVKKDADVASVPLAEREGSATGGDHGDAPRAKHAATQESEAEAYQHGLTLLQPTVVEISAAVVDKAKAGEHDSMEDLQHSIADVGGSPPSRGRGRRRQRKSDGEEEYDTAVPRDINTRSKRRQKTGGADDAGGAEFGTMRGSREASGMATGHALRKKGRPAARRTSGGRRGKKAGDAGDE
ncbi:unnamed protein product [Closterium sp. NIES-54]